MRCGGRKACNIVYWLALTLWASAQLSAGVAAIGVFGTLPRIDMRLERYQPALGDDAREHGILAGGMVMEPIFTATDLAQAGVAVLVLIALLLQLTMFGLKWKSPSNVIRILSIGGAIAILAIYMITMAPRMNRELRSYWRALEAADVATVAQHQQTFEADHVTATRFANARLVLLLIAIGASAAAFTITPPQQAKP